MHRVHRHTLGIVVALALATTAMGEFAAGGTTANATLLGFAPAMAALVVLGGSLGAVFGLIALAGIWGIVRETVLAEEIEDMGSGFTVVPFVVLFALLAAVGWFIVTGLGDMSLVNGLEVPFVEQAFGG